MIRRQFILLTFCMGLIVSLFPLLDRAATSTTEHPRKASCDTQTKSTLSPNGLYYADIKNALCSGLGGSYAISVAVRERATPPNKGSIVFAYRPGPFSGPLVVHWIDSENLSISVDHIEYIDRQVGLEGTVFIHYKIGHVGDLYDEDEAKNRNK